jgi:hypothetical protein
VYSTSYNQRKNVRQIAQEAKMSFRNIAAILKKKDAAVNDGSSSDGRNGIVLVSNQRHQLGNGSQSNQKSTQVYKLFTEVHNSLSEVARTKLGKRTPYLGSQNGFERQDLGHTKVYPQSDR